MGKARKKPISLRQLDELARSSTFADRQFAMDRLWRSPTLAKVKVIAAIISDPDSGAAYFPLVTLTAAKWNRLKDDAKAVLVRAMEDAVDAPGYKFATDLAPSLHHVPPSIHLQFIPRLVNAARRLGPSSVSAKSVVGHVGQMIRFGVARGFHDLALEQVMLADLVASENDPLYKHFLQDEANTGGPDAKRVIEEATKLRIQARDKGLTPAPAARKRLRPAGI